MLKSRYEKELNAPRKLIFELLRDRQVDINLKLPNVAGCRVVEDGMVDNCRRRIVTEVTGEAPIPAFLKPILSKKQLVWLSIQTWDNSRWTCDYSTEAIFFKDNVDVSGRWFFNEKSPGRTFVVIEGIIKINPKGIPGLPIQLATPVAALVEHIIHRMSGPNFEKVFRIVDTMAREEKRAARKRG